jgi:hypothetical protein
LCRGQPVAHQVVGFALGVVAQNVGRGVPLQNVLVGVDQKTAGAGGQVADALTGLGVKHFDHHPDDVAGRAELAVAAGRGQLAQQVFVQVALHVLVLGRNLHLLDHPAGFDEQAGLVDFELGVLHVALERAARLAQAAKPGEDLGPDVLQGRSGLEMGPVAPAHLFRQARLKGLAAALGLAFAPVFLVVQPLEKDQVRELFNGVGRVGQPARPQFVPQLVDLGAKFGVGEQWVLLIVRSELRLFL